MKRKEFSFANFPRLERRTRELPSEPVPPSAWHRLKVPIDLRIPSPPPSDFGEPVRIEPLGPKLAGVSLEVRRIRTLAYLFPGKPPLGFEYHENWSEVPGTDFGEFEVREPQPGRWEVSQLASAYRQARRMLRRIGLPHHGEAWCWRDPTGDWWAIWAPDDASLSPASASDLNGAWIFNGFGRHAGNWACPSDFLDAFGGAMGPLAWAYFVIEASRDLRSVAPNAADNGFALGLEIGQGLAEFAVLGQVAASEARRAATGGKPELRSLVREIAIAEAALGPLKPHKLAAVLLAEGATTERGRSLARLGLPGLDRLGRVIAEEAEAAGVYRCL